MRNDGPDSQEWQEQVAVGDAAERGWRDVLTSWGCTNIEAAPEGEPGWDVAARMSYEVKADERAKRTGNAFIELRQKGRPSGLNVTTANIWVIHGAGEWYVVPTPNLRELVKNAKTVSAFGGTKVGALVRLADLRREGMVITDDVGITLGKAVSRAA